MASDKTASVPTRYLLGYSVFVHGPVDMLTTATHWEHESNPIVLEMGLEPWLAVKTAFVVATVVLSLYYMGSNERAVRAFLWVLSIMTVLIWPNLLVVAGLL